MLPLVWAVGIQPQFLRTCGSTIRTSAGAKHVPAPSASNSPLGLCGRVLSSQLTLAKVKPVD